MGTQLISAGCGVAVPVVMGRLLDGFRAWVPSSDAVEAATATGGGVVSFSLWHALGLCLILGLATYWRATADRHVRACMGAVDKDLHALTALPCHHPQSFYLTIRASAQAAVALQAAVFNKALRLASDARKRYDVGTIATLMSNDACKAYESQVHAQLRRF